MRRKSRVVFYKLNAYGGAEETQPRHARWDSRPIAAVADRLEQIPSKFLGTIGWGLQL